MQNLNKRKSLSDMSMRSTYLSNVSIFKRFLNMVILLLILVCSLLAVGGISVPTVGLIGLIFLGVLGIGLLIFLALLFIDGPWFGYDD